MKIRKKKVSFIMAEKDMFQKDLADKAGMSRGNLSVLLNGKNCQPKTILKIANALKVGIEDILEDTD